MDGRFTDQSRKILELSLREALQLGHNYIGPEHILLSLVRYSAGDGKGNAAAAALQASNMDLDAMRAAVLKALAGHESKVRAAEKPEKAWAASGSTSLVKPRLEALKLAVANSEKHDMPDDIVTAAEVYEKFLNGNDNGAA